MKNVLSGLLSIMLLFISLTPGLCEEASTADGPALSLLAINVRKADCLLLRCGESAYLIDTGSKDSVDQVLRVLADQGVTRLDGIILTHTHSDHAGGLRDLLLSDLQVDQIYASRYYDKKDEKHPAVKALNKIGKKSDQYDDMEIVWLSSGDELPLDGGSLKVLGPIQESETENCNSLVLLAEGGGGTMLLAGDMEFPEETELLNAGLLTPVDVLKVGNHGEEDATGPNLIRAITPKVAVISTNTEDEPDTPHKRVMKLLAQYGVTVYQTQDTANGVLVTIQGGEITAAGI